MEKEEITEWLVKLEEELRRLIDVENVDVCYAWEIVDYLLWPLLAEVVKVE